MLHQLQSTAPLAFISLVEAWDQLMSQNYLGGINHGMDSYLHPQVTHNLLVWQKVLISRTTHLRHQKPQNLCYTRKL